MIILKKFLCGLILGIIVSLSMVGIATELNIVPNPFPVLINNVVTEVEGYNINDYTYLKLADFRKTGLTVKFNETDRQIEITGGTNTMSEDTIATQTTEQTSTTSEPSPTPSPTPNVPVKPIGK